MQLVVSPVSDEYVPAGHGVHPPASPLGTRVYLPCSHRVHAEAPCDPYGEYVPAGHGWHVSAVTAPFTVQNLPASHGMHCCSDVSWVSLAYLPAGHCVHVLCPSLLLKEPSQQPLQLVAPSTSEYVPAGHCPV